MPGYEALPYIVSFRCPPDVCRDLANLLMFGVGSVKPSSKTTEVAGEIVNKLLKLAEEAESDL